MGEDSPSTLHSTSDTPSEHRKLEHVHLRKAQVLAGVQLARAGKLNPGFLTYKTEGTMPCS